MTMRAEPIVSIIIPCYNMGNFLAETIQSVEQVYNPAIHEVIIVDDGSTDEKTKEILAGVTRHQVVRQQNAGVANARNKGLKRAAGQYLIFLDADNLLTDGYLGRGVAVLDQHADIDIIYGESEIFGATTGWLPTRPFNLQTLMTYNYIDTCCLVRRSVFEDIGGFDENMRDKTGIEDWEMWLRAAYHGKRFHYLEGVTIQKYRMRDDSMMRKLNRSKKKRDAALAYLEKKFPSFLSFTEVSDFYFRKFDDQPFGWSGKLFIKKFFPRWFKKLVQSGRLSEYL